MATLPVVKLRRVVRGREERRVVNQTDYARDIAGWGRNGWELVSMKGGSAEDAVVMKAAEQSDIELHRKTDPAEMKKRGDAQRAFEARAVTVSTTPKLPDPEPDAAPEEPVSEPEPATPVAKPDIDPDWEKLPWFKRRAYVEQITGARPKDAAEAKTLMAPFA